MGAGKEKAGQPSPPYSSLSGAQSFVTRKGVWGSAYTESHFFPPLFLETIRNCINRAGWQGKEHPSPALPSLCQAYAPFKRRKHSFADPVREQVALEHTKTATLENALER